MQAPEHLYEHRGKRIPMSGSPSAGTKLSLPSPASRTAAGHVGGVCSDLGMLNRLLFMFSIFLAGLVGAVVAFAFFTYGAIGLAVALTSAFGAAVTSALFVRGHSITVAESTVAVVERLGAFSRVLYPGAHFLLGPFDHVRTIVETTEQQHEFIAEKVLIGGSAQPTLCMLVRYRIIRRVEDGEEIADEQAVRRAAYEVKDWKEATKRQAEATLRDVLGETGWRDEFLGVSATGDTIIPRPRTYINSRLRFHLDRETRRWGVSVTRCSVQVVHVDQASLDSVFAIRAARRKAELARILAESEVEIARIRKPIDDQPVDGRTVPAAFTLDPLAQLKLLLEATSQLAKGMGRVPTFWAREGRGVPESIELTLRQQGPVVRFDDVERAVNMLTLARVSDEIRSLMKDLSVLMRQREYHTDELRTNSLLTPREKEWTVGRLDELDDAMADRVKRLHDLINAVYENP